jgi:hypothetical protein
MTPMTLMTMNCRGSLNGVRPSAVRSRNGVMGREQWERKCDKARRCSHLVRPLGDREKRHAPAAASRSLRAPGPRPACAGRSHRAALAENAAPGSLLVSIFYTTLVKKSQRANGASEHLRTPPQHHLALTYTATSISGAVRPALGIFVTLLHVNTYAASSVQHVIAHK